MLDQSPTPAMLFEEMLTAMESPMPTSGSPRRPTLIYLSNAEAVEALAPRLAELDVKCEFKAELPEMKESLAELTSALNRGEELIPGLVTIPSISDALLAHFYELAADYYRAAPWRWFTDLFPLEIRYPPSAAPRFVVVMGSGREVFGLAAYPSIEELQTVYRVSPKKALKRTTSLVLLFEEAVAMSFDDLDAVAEHHWPIAAENAYPVLGIQEGRELKLPILSDVIWMEGALAGMLAYLREQKKVRGYAVQPFELTLPISSVSGPAEIYLRCPAFDPLEL
jgi:hypothetical protein